MIAAIYGVLHGPQGPVFVDQIYPQSFAALIFWTASAAAIYYYWLGSVSSRYNTLFHWAMALVAAVTASVITVLGVGRFAYGEWDLDAPLIILAIIQALYAALLFAVISLFVKQWSPQARCTPWRRWWIAY